MTLMSGKRSFFDQLVRRTSLKHLTFERTVRDLSDILATGSKEDALDSVLARACESHEHVAVLLNYDWIRTQVAHELVRIPAACLRGDAIWGENDSADHREEIEFEIFDTFDMEALFDWACVAMYRPGATLDWTSDEALRTSFLAYADQLRHDILTHLRGAAGQNDRPSPAAA